MVRVVDCGSRKTEYEKRNIQGVKIVVLGRFLVLRDRFTPARALADQ